MLFLEEKGPAVRVACAAGLLVLGEAVGFALAQQGFAEAWPWMGFAAFVGGLAAYGWGVRHMGLVLPFLFGILLALRTEAVLQGILDANAGLYGPRPRLTLPVEGDVRRKWNAKADRERVDFLSHVGPLPLKVILSLPQGEPTPQIGETWQLDGWIARKADPEDRYGRRTLWVHEARAEQNRFGPSPHSARAGWAAVGDELARRATAGLSWCPELAGLNRAILLGRRNDLSRERKQVFADAGTIHVFAISGLHVMVVAWLLQTTLAKVGLPVRLRGLVAIPLMWAYVVLTGARPSAIRAAAMATLLLVAPVLGRRPDALTAWSVTVLAVYGYAPERLFDLGCALSFAVMFGIVFWCHWSRHFEPWFDAGSRWRKWAGDFGVSCSAWAAGVPIMAHAFGRFTPGGLVANIVVLVCAKWMVRVGAGGLVVSFVCLPLAALMNNFAAASTWTMTWVSEQVASLPFSNFTVSPWPLPVCALWYLGCLLLLALAERLLPRRGLHARRWWKRPRTT